MQTSSALGSYFGSATKSTTGACATPESTASSAAFVEALLRTGGDNHAGVDGTSPVEKLFERGGLLLLRSHDRLEQPRMRSHPLANDSVVLLLCSNHSVERSAKQVTKLHVVHTLVFQTCAYEHRPGHSAGHHTLLVLVVFRGRRLRNTPWGTLRSRTHRLLFLLGHGLLGRLLLQSVASSERLVQPPFLTLLLLARRPSTQQCSYARLSGGYPLNSQSSMIRQLADSPVRAKRTQLATHWLMHSKPLYTPSRCVRGT